MAWLYENSPGWRRFVNYTRQSKRYVGSGEAERERKKERRERERERAIIIASSLFGPRRLDLQTQR